MGSGGCAMDVLGSRSSVTGWLLGGLLLALSLLSVRLGRLPPPLSWIRRRRKKPVRVYMDGCFDMMHYGHCNALRQARALGDQLVVGVVSDDEITANKGPPVTPLHERMIMVGAVKWVDEVIPNAPYAITEEFMNKLFTEYNIDYIIHGDDPCLLPDGTDAYALAKKAGRYKQIKRTEGVSSTDIFSHGHNQKVDDVGSGSGTRGPGPDAHIVYIDGAFDLFHAGHVELPNILRLARELGDFLLVGIHTDQTISATRGAHRPIMNLHERSLSVLACRYVDEVIIGAPWEVSKDMKRNEKKEASERRYYENKSFVSGD
ncbi:ethanolamine-phosphate cytidylyltransferase [Musa troglodytarum]|uniref:ethanolamine-phosphate cytidylyltransferase n=1 Tax=Musa troglodytarum TaxID=320322 RepID=A0A9E7IC61_9LILI|nr:ethanolamine-phosphate cytidylyltransferase [Musa troglodytarum]